MRISCLFCSSVVKPLFLDAQKFWSKDIAGRLPCCSRRCRFLYSVNVVYASHIKLVFMRLFPHSYEPAFVTTFRHNWLIRCKSSHTIGHGTGGKTSNTLFVACIDGDANCEANATVPVLVKFFQTRQIMIFIFLHTRTKLVVWCCTLS